MEAPFKKFVVSSWLRPLLVLCIILQSGMSFFIPATAGAQSSFVSTCSPTQAEVQSGSIPGTPPGMQANVTASVPSLGTDPNIHYIWSYSGSVPGATIVPNMAQNSTSATIFVNSTTATPDGKYYFTISVQAVRSVPATGGTVPLASASCTGGVIFQTPVQYPTPSYPTPSGGGTCPAGYHDPHKECQDLSCADVPGCGVDSCTGDGQCQTPGGYYMWCVPPTRTVGQGQATQYTMLVVATRGFSYPISTTVYPTGVAGLTVTGAGSVNMSAYNHPTESFIGPDGTAFGPGEVTALGSQPLTAQTTSATPIRSGIIIPVAGPSYGALASSTQSQNCGLAVTAAASGEIRAKNPATGNFDHGTVVIPNDTATDIRWTSQNVDSCTVSGAGSWTGRSDTKSSGTLSGPQSYVYNLDCTGTSGSVHDSVTVQVQAPTAVGDFTISCSPGTMSITPGGVANFSASVLHQNGLNVPITVTATTPDPATLPAMVIGSPVSPPGGIATVVIRAAANAPSRPGVFQPILITGTSTAGSPAIVHSCTVGLEVRGGTPPGGSVCGDGVKDVGEQCDLGIANGSCPVSCSTTCNVNICGGNSCVPNTFIAATSKITPQTVAPGGGYTISCDYGVKSNSIKPIVGSGSCSGPTFAGTKAVFACVAGLVPGSYSNSCTMSRGGPDFYCEHNNTVNSLIVTPPTVSVGTSDKDIVAVNGISNPADPCSGTAAADGIIYGTDKLTAVKSLRVGDVLTFKLNICNRGSQSAETVSAADSSSQYLEFVDANRAVFSSDCSSGSTVSNATGSNATFSIGPTVPAGKLCSITFDMRIASPVIQTAGHVFKVQNCAVIKGKGFPEQTTCTPLILVGTKDTPTRNEIAPY